MSLIKSLKRFVRRTPILYNVIAPVYYRLKGSNGVHSYNILTKFPSHTKEYIEQLALSSKGIYFMEPTISWIGNLLQRPQHMAIAMGKIGFLSIYTDFGVPANMFYKTEQNTFLTGPDQSLYKFSKMLRIVYSTCYPYEPQTLKQTRQESHTIIYEFVDDLHDEISGPRTDELIELYNFMVKQKNADLVIVTAKKLQDKVINDGFPQEKVLYLPNGVEVTHFQNPTEITFTEELRQFLDKYPVIVGYHGAIAPWLWFDVIQDLINIMRDVGFLFIGPLYDINRFPLRGENVYWTGKVDYEILPAYVKHYTIGWIPFKPGPIAQATSPLKLFEYFASGKPVVVTHDMIECTQFDLVFSGSGTTELKDAIERAISKSNDKQFIAQLKALSMEHTWERRALTLEQFLAKHGIIIS